MRLKPRRFIMPTTTRRVRAYRHAHSGIYPVALVLIVVFVFADSLLTRAQETTTVATDSARRADDARRKGTITVRVVGEDGQPVPNAIVSAFKHGASARNTFDNTGASTGRYLLTNLDPGVYLVSVFAPGYVPEVDRFADPAERNLYRPGDSAMFRLLKGGVVTGKVVDAAGEPVVGARVKAVRLRDAAGRPVRDSGFEFFGPRERRTDDRGIYRVYGLPSGTYVVVAGGRGAEGFAATRPSTYDSDAPTFYPSATRDTAVELQVQAGQELNNIDIRHRGEQGHAVSGTVTGTFAPQAFGSGAAVVLRHPATGATEGFAFVNNESGTPSFAFEGLGDGDYEITATSSNEKGSATSSPSQRVSVRGADVTGLRLVLAPLGSLAGQLSFEPLSERDAARPECANRRTPLAQESLIFVRRQDASSDAQLNFFNAPSETAPDEKGEFAVRNLRAGRYRLAVRLTDEDLFLRSLTMPAARTSKPSSSNTPGATTPTRAAASLDLARGDFNIGAGESLTGVSVSVGQGAASLRGRVTARVEGETLPENLRVHLVPAERERADDLLRYAEATVQTDGTFAFTNLAPGRYLLTTRAAPEGEPRPASPTPLAWNTETRAALRREAEAANVSTELHACQRVADFVLKK